MTVVVVSVALACMGSSTEPNTVRSLRVTLETPTPRAVAPLRFRVEAEVDAIAFRTKPVQFLELFVTQQNGTRLDTSEAESFPRHRAFPLTELANQRTVASSIAIQTATPQTLRLSGLIYALGSERGAPLFCEAEGQYEFRWSMRLEANEPSIEHVVAVDVGSPLAADLAVIDRLAAAERESLAFYRKEHPDTAQMSVLDQDADFIALAQIRLNSLLRVVEGESPGDFANDSSKALIRAVKAIADSESRSNFHSLACGAYAFMRAAELIEEANVSVRKQAMPAGRSARSRLPGSVEFDALNGYIQTALASDDEFLRPRLLLKSAEIFALRLRIEDAERTLQKLDSPSMPARLRARLAKFHKELPQLRAISSAPSGVQRD